MTDKRPVGLRAARGGAAARGGRASATVPAGAVLLDDDTMARLVPDRAKRGHKGTFGKLLVIAGSLDYAGAALLVCRAAGRAGAGLVTLAVPESLQPLFAAKVVEATTMALPEDDVEEVDPEPALAKILDHEHDALVVGPGLRPSLAIADLLRLLLTAPEEGSPAPVVLDAEALRTLASADGWWDRVTRPCVLTPHAGEFARLRAGSGHVPADDGDLDRRRRGAGRRPPRPPPSEWRQVVVLKGARTVIAAPDGSVAIAPFENAGHGERAARATCSRARSARCSPRASRRSTPRGSACTSTASRASSCGSGSATRACSRATCRTRCRSAASASRSSRSGSGAGGGSGSARA